MKDKNSTGRSVARVMTAAITLCIILSYAIMPAAAKAPPNFFDGWSWDGSKQPLQPLPGQNVVGTITLEPVVVPTPPYRTDNPQARALYLGSCPIGTGNAPQLRQTALSSGAQCRGACGIDCPPERCKAVADIAIPFEGGTCIYKNVISCPSHQGCRDHDACYDICTEQLGDSSLLLGICHGICNGRCYDEWNYPDCILWAALPGTLSSSASGMVDSTMVPTFDRNLVFSDPPQFKPAATPTDQYPEFAKLALHYTATRYAVTDSSSFDPDCGYADKAYEISGKDPYCEKTPSYSDAVVMCGKPPAKCIDTKWNGGIHAVYTYYNTLGTKADGTQYVTARLKDGDMFYYATDGTVVSQVTYKDDKLVRTVK